MAQSLGRSHGTCWRKIASVTLATATAFAFTVPAGAVATTVPGDGSQVQSVHAQTTGDTWKIIWETNGGTYNDPYYGSSLPQQYKEGTGVGYFEWPDDDCMEKDGYTFEGWYTNPEFTGDSVTGISESESGDKTFYAKWKKDVSYKVTFGESAHGAVALSSYSTSPAKAGATMYLDVSPDEGYALQKLTVKDESGNKVPVSESFGMKSFTMPESDVTVSAEFVLESELKSTVDVSVDGQYTSDATEFDKKVGEGQDLYVKVSPSKASGNLAESDIAELKIQWFVDDSAEPVQEDQGQWNSIMGSFKGSGYRYSYKCPTAGTHKVTAKAVWTIDGQAVESDPVTFTFHVTAAQTYAYKMNIQPSEHGKITASQDGFNEGDTVIFAIAPEEGYEIDTLIITDGDGSEHDAEISADGKTATFTFDGYWDDDYDMVTATFKSPAQKVAHSIKAEQSQHGSYTLDSTNVIEGETAVIRTTPDDGYNIPYKDYESLVKVTDASGNSVAVFYSGSNIFTFTMPASDVTLSVDFKKDEAQAPGPVEQFNSLVKTFAVDTADADQAQKLIDAYEALDEQQRGMVDETGVLTVKVAEKIIAADNSETARAAAEANEKAAEAAQKAAEEQAAAAKTAQEAAEQAAKDAQVKQAAAEKAQTEAETKQKTAEKAAGDAEAAQKAAEEQAAAAKTAQETAEANEKAAEAAQKAAEDKLAAAEEAKTRAETKQAAAEKAAGDAKDAQKAAEDKLAAAEEAKTQAETKQKTAEKAAGDAKDAQKTAEKAAGDARAAQKAAREKLAAAEKAASDVQTTLVKASSVTKVKVKAKKGKKAKVSWKAPKYFGGVTYQVAYKAKGAKKWATKSSAKTTCTVGKLKAGKKYKFRVRAFKKINGKKVYTSWMLYKDGASVKAKK